MSRGPRVPAGLLPDRAGLCARLAQDHGVGPDRRGCRLALPTATMSSRLRAGLVRPFYTSNLLSPGLPALECVLATGARRGTVADVGCGQARRRSLMAQALPRARPSPASDLHEGSIETARRRSADSRPFIDASAFETRRGLVVLRPDYEPGDHVRLPARHGRPRRGGPARPQSRAPDVTWMIVDPLP